MDRKGTIYVTDHSIRLPKIGEIEAKIHRTAPEGWKLKSATVSMESDEKYYI